MSSVVVVGASKTLESTPAHGSSASSFTSGARCCGRDLASIDGCERKNSSSCRNGKNCSVPRAGAAGHGLNAQRVPEA